MLVKFKNSNLEIIYINNVAYFKAKDICDILGFKNSREAVSIHCDKEGVASAYTLTITGKKKATFINEQNLYALIFNVPKIFVTDTELVKATKLKAKDFQKWVFNEVLPTIRKTGSYSIFQDNTMKKHLNVSEQKNNSKLINSDKFHSGGVDAIKNYNRLNCLIHTGKSTKYIKEFGIKKGLKKQDCQSAKQVIRKISPATACAMSFADSVLHTNPDKTLQDIKPASLAAIKVFDEMLKIGIIPIEILDKKK